MKISKVAFFLIIALNVNFISAQSNLIGLWNGEVTRNGFDWKIQLHIGETEEGIEVRVSLPDFGMFQLETDSLLLNKSHIWFKIKWLDVYFEGVANENYLEGNWDKGTALARLHKTSLEVGLLRTTSVSLTMDDGAILKGTLILPDEEPPYHGMVFTHGSGPDIRSTGPYLSKAMLAAQNGIAALIYDKRGAGESTGEKAYDILRLAKDAEAMFEWLRKQSLIDSTKVGVGGSSQGAWVAPKVAYENSNVAFVFVVATPGMSPAEQNVFTLKTRLEAAGMSEQAIREAKKGLRTLYDYYRTGDQYYRTKALEKINTSTADWAKTRIFQGLMFAQGGKVAEKIDVPDWSFMFVDPLIWWQEIKVPVASFSGADDNNIPTEFSINVIKTALEYAGNEEFELHVYPDAGHGITLVNRKEGDWQRVASGYIAAMAAWFSKMAKK